jgi:hypothetical protein
MSKDDAIKLASDAVKGHGYSLGDYLSTKRLKGKSVKREVGGMYVGKRWRDVNCCLDWTCEEWTNLLNDLTK